MATLMDTVEAALVAYLNNNITLATAVPGISATDKPLPFVACTATRETESDDGANSLVTCRIEIKGTGSDADNWKALCEEVRDALWLESEDLGGQIESSGTDLVCFAGMPDRNVERDVSDDVWTETHNVTFYCALTA